MADASASEIEGFAPQVAAFERRVNARLEAARAQRRGKDMFQQKS